MPNASADRVVMTPHAGRIFASILLAGLVLRILGLTWGLPSNVIPGELPFHPDELVAFEQGGDLYRAPDPITFTWGGVFYFRLAWLARNAAGLLGAGTPAEAKVLTLVMLRLANVLFALVSAGAIRRAGQRLFGDRAGLLAAFLFLSFPAHVLESHYGRPDVLQVLLATVSLAAAAEVATGGGLRWLAGGSLAAGLAIATMQWGYVALVPLAIAVMVGGRDASFPAFARRVLTSGVLVGAVALLGYGLGSIETLTFWKVFLVGRQRASVMHGASSYRIAGALLLPVSFYSFGTLSTLAAYAGGIVTLRPGSPRKRWIVSGQLLAGCLLVGLIQGEMMRYVLFLAPSVALLAAFVIDGVIEALAARSAHVDRVRAVAYAVVAVAALQVPVSYVWPMQFGEDARYRAGRWINGSAPLGAQVGVAPSFYGDWTYVPRFPDASRIQVNEQQLRSNFDSSYYLDIGFAYWALSDFTMADALKSSAAGFVTALRSGDRYRVAARFGPPWQPLCIPRLLGFPQPGDLLYVRQTFTVFERADLRHGGSVSARD